MTGRSSNVVPVELWLGGGRVAKGCMQILRRTQHLLDQKSFGQWYWRYRTGSAMRFTEQRESDVDHTVAAFDQVITTAEDGGQGL